MATVKSTIRFYPVGHEDQMITFEGVVERCNSQLEKERYCLEIQRNTPDFIERNRRLMKAGKIDFDDYEEIDSTIKE